MGKIIKEKFQYSMLSNIAYAFKKIWKWDKTYLFTFIPVPFLNILMSFILIITPREIINNIEGKQPISRIIFIIIIIFTAYFITVQIFRYCHYIMSSRFFVISWPHFIYSHLYSRPERCCTFIPMNSNQYDIHAKKFLIFLVLIEIAICQMYIYRTCCNQCHYILSFLRIYSYEIHSRQ